MQRGPEDSLRVSAYDRVASLVVASIVFVGFFVAIMFVVWLTTRPSFTRLAVPVTLLDEPSGRGDHAAGYERDLEEPGVEEVEELAEPQVEAALEAVTEAATAQIASLDALDTDAVATGKGRGLGDSRAAGPGGEGNVIPRWMRWDVRFASKGVNAYAQQLDFFGIELAAVGGGKPLVDYASGFSKPQPVHRTGKGGNEQRLYMSWREGILQEFDRQLLARAGVETQGRILLQFYPKPVEDQLALLEQLEMRKAGKTSLDEIRKTVFGVRRDGSKFNLYIVQQEYRAAAN
jgi:hypothetical protein